MLAAVVSPVNSSVTVPRLGTGAPPKAKAEDPEPEAPSCEPAPDLLACAKFGLVDQLVPSYHSVIAKSAVL